jgi:superfamily II DNA or RNA helicase
MTATPWRGDERQLAAVFGDSPPVYRLSVVDAVRLGYLADVAYIVFDDHIDWQAVQLASKHGLSINDLNRRLWIPERESKVAAIVREWVEKLRTGSADARTLVFCRSIEHTERAAHALRTVGLNAVSLHSGLARFDVTRRLQAFRDGVIPVLAVVDMLNEGIDVPDVELIVFNRVTHSRRVFLQQLGRGLRPLPGKAQLTVLDFVADVRRLAELLNMEREYQAGPRPDEVLHMSEHLVSFSSQALRSFVDAFLADIADLDHLGDDSLELFPPSVGP